MRALKSLKSLKAYYSKDKGKIILLGIVMLIGNVETLLFSALWGLILENLVAGKFFEAILFILLQLVLFLFDIGIDALINYLQCKLEVSMLKNIQIDIYKKVINYPAVAFEEHGVGELNNRIHGDTDRIVSLFSNFISLISRFISAIIVVFVFIKISVVLGIEIIVFGIVTFFISRYYSPKMKEANKKVKKENDALMKDTTEILTGVREVKALGIKQRVISLTSNKFANVFNSSYDSQMLNVTHYTIEWFVYAIFEFITLFTGAYLFYQGAITISVIVIIYNYLSRVNWAVQSYTEFIGDYQKLAVALERVDEILNDRLYKPESFGDKTLNNVKGQIEFKNIDFTYDNDEKATLHNLSLTVKPHIKTAIVGSSGSGKTSLFNLLLRYFKANKGSITIDGVPLEEISEDSLRSNVSAIRQDTFLFNLSIMDNFRIVKEDVTLKEVRNACKKAYIDNYIMDLPNGYDSIIGENGVNLSGGQKQRISIARALIKNAKIILLDEATSALDNKSQEYIKKTIDELVKDHTIIIIAHRLSTIIDADEIVLMEKGKIIASGTHKELMKNEKYKELYKPDVIE